VGLWWWWVSRVRRVVVRLSCLVLYTRHSIPRLFGLRSLPSCLGWRCPVSESRIATQPGSRIITLPGYHSTRKPYCYPARRPPFPSVVGSRTSE
jgi:hypothetical protein